VGIKLIVYKQMYLFYPYYPLGGKLGGKGNYPLTHFMRTGQSESSFHLHSGQTQKGTSLPVFQRSVQRFTSVKFV